VVVVDDHGSLVPRAVPNWYNQRMATNLRLRAEAERALRDEAERTGRSQQELIREAVDRYLGLSAARPATSDRDAVVSSGLALPARRAYAELEELVRLPDGLTTTDLLDRDDRV
jgi:Ribbon-helix-helix protein, copG family